VLERPSPKVLDAAHRGGVAILPYFPLANGLLTGKYRRDEPLPADSRLGADGLVSQMLRDGLMARRPPLSDARLGTVERLTSFSEKRGHSLLELAVSWLAAQPLVGSVLTGVTRPEQVTANAAAADWKLTSDDLDEVEAIVAAEESNDGQTPG